MIDTAGSGSQAGGSTRPDAQLFTPLLDDEHGLSRSSPAFLFDDELTALADASAWFPSDDSVAGSQITPPSDLMPPNHQTLALSETTQADLYVYIPS